MVSLVLSTLPPGATYQEVIDNVKHAGLDFKQATIDTANERIIFTNATYDGEDLRSSQAYSPAPHPLMPALYVDGFGPFPTIDVAKRVVQPAARGTEEEMMLELRDPSLNREFRPVKKR